MAEPIDIPDATREPEQYVQALLKVLDGRDAITVYAETPVTVERLCDGLEATEWQRSPAPGEWTPLQIVGHLLDVDIVYGFRWRLTITEVRPSYPGYDEKRWAELARPDPPTLLRAFGALRTVNVALLRSLNGDDWKRTGVHGEQGQETVQRMADKIAGHDIAHVNQLERAIGRSAQ
jgi:DinB superfamily